MQLEVGKRYEVTVKQILDKVGAVVLMEDGSTELVHISNIADCFVDDVSKYVTVGDELVAMCQEGKTRPVELTFRNLKLHRKDGDVDSARHTVTARNTASREDVPYKKHRNPYSSSAITSRSNTKLDEMIENSNKEYENKFKSQNKGRKRK